jgi:hypothetical protein
MGSPALVVERPPVGERALPPPHLLPVAEEERVRIDIYPSVSAAAVSIFRAKTDTRLLMAEDEAGHVRHDNAQFII